MTFKSYSQTGQDRFAYELIGERGTFLDVGCNHPIEINNTYGLEQIGWKGMLVDNDTNCIHICQQHRTAICVLRDAEQSWRGFGERTVDYLSLDCNGATFGALCALLNCELQFRVITIETDAYRFGKERRDMMRDSLRRKGYDMICAGVRDKDMEFEDWWASLDLSEKAEKYRCSDKDWKDIFNDAK